MTTKPTPSNKRAARALANIRSARLQVASAGSHLSSVDNADIQLSLNEANRALVLAAHEATYSAGSCASPAPTAAPSTEKLHAFAQIAKQQISDALKDLGSGGVVGYRTPPQLHRALTTLGLLAAGLAEVQPIDTDGDAPSAEDVGEAWRAEDSEDVAHLDNLAKTDRAVARLLTLQRGNRAKQEELEARAAKAINIAHSARTLTAGRFETPILGDVLMALRGEEL